MNCPKHGNNHPLVTPAGSTCDVRLNWWAESSGGIRRTVVRFLDVGNWSWDGTRNAIFVIMVAVSLFASVMRNESGSNWQLMKTAVVTAINGSNPYLPSEAQQQSAVNLSFPYNAIWLAPIAALVVCGKHQIVLFSLFVAGLFVLPSSYKDKAFAGAFVLSLMATLHSGNIALLEFFGMCCIFRHVHDGRTGLAAVFLGVLSTIKLLPISFIIGFQTWRLRAKCLAGFLAALVLGFAAFPHYTREYIRCLLGVQGYASVTSELHVSGMDNQAVYQHGGGVSLFTFGIVFCACLVLWHRRTSPIERMATAILSVFLLLPRIPPHAYLAYASVPMLVIYQTLRPCSQWIMSACCILTGWLLVCRFAGMEIPPTVQYWSTLAAFLLGAVDAALFQPTKMARWYCSNLSYTERKN